LAIKNENIKEEERPELILYLSKKTFKEKILPENVNSSTKDMDKLTKKSNRSLRSSRAKALNYDTNSMDSLFEYILEEELLPSSFGKKSKKIPVKKSTKESVIKGINLVILDLEVKSKKPIDISAEIFDRPINNISSDVNNNQKTEILSIGEEKSNMNSILSTVETNKYFNPDNMANNKHLSNTDHEKSTSSNYLKRLDFSNNFGDMINNYQNNNFNNKGNFKGIKNEINGIKKEKVDEIEDKVEITKFLSTKRKKPKSKEIYKGSNVKHNFVNNAINILEQNLVSEKNQKVNNIETQSGFKNISFNIDNILNNPKDFFMNIEENFTKKNETLEKIIYSSTQMSTQLLVKPFKPNESLDQIEQLENKEMKSDNQQKLTFPEEKQITFDRSLRNEYAKTLNFINNFSNDYTAISLQKDSEKYNEDQTHFIKRKQSTSNIKRKCGVSYVKNTESFQKDVEDRYE